MGMLHATSWCPTCIFPKLLPETSRVLSVVFSESMPPKASAAAVLMEQLETWSYRGEKTDKNSYNQNSEKGEKTARK